MINVHYGKINTDIQKNITGSFTNITDISVADVQTLVDNNEEPNYISFDGLGIDLQDNNKKFYASDYAGALFSNVSDDNCTLPGTDGIRLSFSSAYNGDITIKFYGNCCRKFTAKYIFSDTTSQYEEIEVDSELISFTPSFNNIYSLEIYFEETALPHQYIKISYIKCGSTVVFKNIKSAELTEEINILSDDLPINSFNFSIFTDDPIDFVSGATVNVYSNNKYYGTFYVDEAERTSKNTYDIKALNILNTLEKNNFVNWKNLRTEATDFINEIKTLTNANFITDSVDLTNYSVFGHMPIKTARFALCGYAFACCFMVDTSRSDKITLKELPIYIKSFITTEDKRIIGEAKYKKSSAVTSAVYAYPYGYTEKEVTIEPNNAANEKLYLTFENAPIEIYKIDGSSTISNQSLNHIEFSAGTANTTLYGKQIELNTQNSTIENYMAIENGENSNEKKFDGFSLRGIYKGSGSTVYTTLEEKKQNAILKYIQSGGTITAKIRLRDEKVGDMIQIETAYDGIKTGIITSMNIRFGYEDIAEIEVAEWQLGLNYTKEDI